jgi:hypothetical protein
MTFKLPWLRHTDVGVQTDFREVEKQLDLLISPPVFRVYRNAALSLATNAVAVFDTVEVDTHGWFDTSTGVFAPQRSGVYRLSWSLRPSAALAADVFWASVLQKNGGTHKIGNVVQQRGTTPVSSVGTSVVQATAGVDSFRIIVSHGAGAAVALAVGSGVSNWFDGEFIRP